MKALKDVLLWLAAFLAVTAVAFSGLYAFKSMGLSVKKSYSAADIANAPSPLEWKATPAYEVISSVLEAQLPNSSSASPVKPLSSSALPPSCLSGVPAAAGSLERLFSSASGPFELSLNAYPAGVGAYAYSKIFDAISSCSGSSASSIGGLGVEASSLTTQPAGVTTSSIMWRRGDVIIIASGSGASIPLTSDVDKILESSLAPLCIDEVSSKDDVSRNPFFNRASFAGFKVPVVVTSPQPSLPSLAPGEDPAVLEVAVPSPNLPYSRVKVPSKPSYPVWPELPTPVAPPVAPTAPKPALVSKTLLIPQADPSGPGCGWAFAGMSAPIFDKASLGVDESQLRKDALSEMKADVPRWQQDVLQYWREYAAYKQQVAAYLAYAQQVSSVRAAWDAIALEWSAYNRDLAAYQSEVDAHAKFLDAQAAAKQDYDAALAACSSPSSPTSSPSPTPSPTPTLSPSPSPSPSPTPSPSPSSPRQTCPPPRPAIIDQTPPLVGPQPTPPPDPRPAG